MDRLDLESLDRFFDFHQLVFRQVGAKLRLSQRVLDKVDHVLLGVKGSVSDIKVEEGLPHLRVADRLMITRPELETTAESERFELWIREEGGARDSADGNVLVRWLVAQDDVERVDNIDHVGAHLAKVAPLALEEIVQSIDVQLADLSQADLDRLAFECRLKLKQSELKSRTISFTLLTNRFCGVSSFAIVYIFFSPS